MVKQERESGKTESWSQLLDAIHKKRLQIQPLLGDCPVLFAVDCNTWKAPRIIIALCTLAMRTEWRTVDCLSPFKTEALWRNANAIVPQLLADEHIVAYKKMRSSGYRDREMLKNHRGELISAVKALHVCLDILTWNAYVLRKSFLCLSNIIQHSNDVISAVVQETKSAHVPGDDEQCMRETASVETGLSTRCADAIAISDEFEKHEGQEPVGSNTHDAVNKSRQDPDVAHTFARQQ